MSLNYAKSETDDSESLSPTVDCQVTEGPPLEMDDDHNELLFKLFSTADCSNAGYMSRRPRGRPPGTRNPPADFMELRRKSGSYDHEEMDDGLLAKRKKLKGSDDEEGPIDVGLMKKLGFLKNSPKGKEHSGKIRCPKAKPEEKAISPSLQLSVRTTQRNEHRERGERTVRAAPLLIAASKEPITRVPVQVQVPRATILRRNGHLQPNGQSTGVTAKDQETVSKADSLNTQTLNPVSDAIKKQSMPLNMDEEALLLYKRSLIAQIERDESMRDYYRLKKAKLEKL